MIRYFPMLGLSANMLVQIEVWLLFNSGQATHEARVEHVQNQIKDWVKNGKQTKLCTARPGWAAMSLRVGRYKKSFRGIDVSGLRSVLAVDEERQTVHVEPNVTMGQLSATLNPKGWTVPVLPELDALTVGGLINGVGVETSSHVHGLFQHTWYTHGILKS